MSTTHKRPNKKANPSKRPLLPLALMLAGLLVLVGGVAFAVIAGNTGASSGTPSLKVEQLKASPNAAIDGLKVDYGDMKLGGDSASLIVYLTNTGNGAIRFTEDPYVELKEGC